MRPETRRLTPEEEVVIMQRVKENKHDRWRPIPEKRPKFGSGLKNEWWWKKKEDR